MYYFTFRGKSRHFNMEEEEYMRKLFRRICCCFRKIRHAITKYIGWRRSSLVLLGWSEVGTEGNEQSKIFILPSNHGIQLFFCETEILVNFPSRFNYWTGHISCCKWSRGNGWITLELSWVLFHLGFLCLT